MASILSKIFFFFVCQSLAETSDVLFEDGAPGAPVLIGVIIGDGFPKHLFCQFDGMLNAVLFARLGILGFHTFAFFGVVEPVVNGVGKVIAVAGEEETAFVECELWGSGAC